MAEKRDPATVIARALSHPLRVTILMKMNTPRRRLSPARFSEETGEPLGNCSYHFRQLDGFGLIELVETKQVRGATEHLYEPTKRAMAWTRAYGKMPDAIKQNLATTALVGAVESIGGAVDAGTFDARPDAHLSFDATVVDLPGWLRMIDIFNSALLKLCKVEEEVRERLKDDPDAETWIASYLMSCWEAATPDTLPPEEPTKTGKLPTLAQLSCFPRAQLVRILDAALEGLRAQPPDSFTPDYEVMRSEVERLLGEAAD